MNETITDRRARLMGPNVPTFYRTPVHIVRGEGVWLWDAAGKRYLDCYNNVPHVGHCHPAVVKAIADQNQLRYRPSKSRRLCARPHQINNANCPLSINTPA